ncbi:hypothetical protein ABKV19_026065, partial [Rosa sericea]
PTNPSLSNPFPANGAFSFPFLTFTLFSLVVTVLNSLSLLLVLVFLRLPLHLSLPRLAFRSQSFRQSSSASSSAPEARRLSVPNNLWRLEDKNICEIIQWMIRTQGFLIRKPRC